MLLTWHATDGKKSTSLPFVCYHLATWKKNQSRCLRLSYLARSPSVAGWTGRSSRAHSRGRMVARLGGLRRLALLAIALACANCYGFQLHHHPPRLSAKLSPLSPRHQIAVLQPLLRTPAPIHCCAAEATSDGEAADSAARDIPRWLLISMGALRHEKPAAAAAAAAAAMHKC